MSSQYPILDNRPIDQWKVTELKEELKRRKLTSRGLKDNLIKRLAEALRIERENAAKEVDGGFDLDPKPVDDVKNPELVSVVAETVKGPVDDVQVQFEVNDDVPTVVQGVVQEGSTTASTKSSSVEEEKLLDYATGVETSNLVTETFVTETVETETVETETVVTEVALNGQDMQNFATHGDNFNINNQLENEDPNPQNEDPNPQNEGPMPQLENEDSKPQLENEDSRPYLENEDSKLQLENENPKPHLENEDSRPQLENEDPKPKLENEALHKDPMLHSSAPNYQVSEVSPLLGSPVKSDSISTDSVSINEKIELKDNIIDDNVKLELDVVKPEMVRSSSNLVAVGGESHPMDVEESHEEQASVEQKDDSNAVNEDMIGKNDSADVEYSEKLNLDRSSGDDSMEEDALETKQIDSKYNDDELGDKSVKNELSVKEEIIIDVVGDDSSADKKDIFAESRTRPSIPAEKRTLNDQEAGGKTEPLKRQRRWKSESLKVPEIQGSNPTRTTTPKDTFQSPGFKRNFSRSNSFVSEDAPKERVVPPSPKPPTNSLRIDRFLRPFTLKAVQELLGKTGQVTDFWMDHIKTHCYVTYSSVEEAVETRNAVYNLKWPSNGGCLLVAEFVDPQEVKIRVEAPQGPPHTPAVPVNTASTTPAAITPQPSPSSRQQFSRHQLLPPAPTLPPPPPPPPLSSPPPVKERLTIPQPSEKVDPPIVTLDDLFRKTKSTPRIYYLPLSEEQVATKLAARSRATKP